MYWVMEMPWESWGGPPDEHVGTYDTKEEAEEAIKKMEANDIKLYHTSLSRYILQVSRVN